MFTTLGRLDNNKNHILLLKASKILKKYREDFEIYLLGEGENRKKLELYIKENKLEDNVKILGFKDNPYPYIKNSIATILTSLSEGFSLALAESALLDTPIISTNVGIAEELIKKYNCGTLIDYDERELADVLLHYMDENDNGKNQKHFYIGNDFDLQTELDKTIQVIDNTIEKADNCMNPTLYVNDLSVGWRIGKNEDYYLKNSSLILKQKRLTF